MNRYPGIRPFTAEDQFLFKGREQEKRDLFQLIILNDIVVLFGESGIGKTSLLQAGVCPELEERSLHPVFIRLNNTSFPPEVQVYQKLIDGDYISDDMPPDLMLWEYLKNFWYVDLGEVFTPVVIFDQFEELFTLYTPEQRSTFVRQFADVANGRVPKKLKNAPFSPRDKDLETPPSLKIVLSIRSDFLYLLDELSADIPAILRTRFQLKMLDRSNAIEAITLPAQMKGNFSSPSFSYHKDALDNIIDVLSKEEKTQLRTAKKSSEPEIEAFQLQLFCQHLENKIIEQKKENGFIVTPSFYDGSAGIQKIINAFYSNVIAKVPADEQIDVEKLLAKGLIRNKRRIIMEESAIKEEFSLKQSTLDFMHDQRLLRKEARKGNLYYEVSHDTLVDPILEKFQLIEKKELEAERKQEQLKREKELEAIKKKAEEEIRKRKRARSIAIIGFILATLAIGGLAVAIYQSNKLQKAGLEISEQAYYAQIQLAINYKIERKFKEAFIQLSKADSSALVLESDKRVEVKSYMERWRAFKFHLNKGNLHLDKGNYKMALDEFQKAKNISTDSPLESLIKQTTIDLEEKFKDHLSDAKKRIKAGLFDLALDSYNAALKLNPDDPFVLQKKLELELLLK